MRYLDTGSGNAESAVGKWLSEEVTQDVSELRIQSGFFSADGLPPLSHIFSALRQVDGAVSVVVGSNGGETLAGHVAELLTEVGAPRPGARVGVVRYANGYYHPKTYHLRRRDGSQVAYVGSANLGFNAMSGLHVEAGLLLDTRSGDATVVLDEIAAAVDVWFEQPRPSLCIVSQLAEVEALIMDGVLRQAPPTRAASESSTPPGRSYPRLSPLFTYPVSKPPVQRQSAATPASSNTAGNRASAPRAPFPDYVLVAAGAIEPTIGAEALTGRTLPAGQVGLIYQLNKDSARHWSGGVGTANVSVPVEVVPTVRFGMYRGERARAEFPMEVRYLSTSSSIRAPKAVATNVMAYGFQPGDTGHGDIRMLVPKAVGELEKAIAAAGHPIPAALDMSFIEWPTPQDPVVRWTLLERGSPMHSRAEGLFKAASAKGQLVGRGASWLPAGLSPSW